MSVLVIKLFCIESFCNFDANCTICCRIVKHQTYSLFNQKSNTLLQFLLKNAGYVIKNNTCLFNITALGWHLVQIPFGQGGCSVQPGLILQLTSSSETYFPLKNKS